MANLQARIDYQIALDQLRQLAQRDLLTWWKLGREEHLGYTELTLLMREPFAAIVETYGEQAAYAAADYLFLERSLDDELRKLPYPELADPVGFEDASRSFYWAMNTVKEEQSAEALALATRKLAGVLNRLVLQPGRETVGGATLKAGTRFARVTEPGACAFCLMLAGRGAVYLEDTHGVGQKWHDNCRCLAIEAKSNRDLPQLNRDVEREWQNFYEYTEKHKRNEDKALSFDVNGWQAYLRRKQNGKL